MSSLDIFLYEWKHFVRNPFKVVALLLFVLAAIYGLHNGANLYHKQKDEIVEVKEKEVEESQKTLTYYEEGKKGPEGRPWIDVSNPFWAIRYTPIYHFKEPSPIMVYSIGQAEQYGFYKRVTFRSSPYDADMAEEIANPERLQSGTLDFIFVVLFLLPLLLLILLYNLKGAETEYGFLPLIEVQVGSKNHWLLSRIAFYLVLLLSVNVLLMLYGASLTAVFANASQDLGIMIFYVVLYLLFWSVIYFFILQRGKSIIGNTLMMMSAWVILAFIIPAMVYQWISIKHPANLMTDLIDSTRDERQKIYDQEDSLIQDQLIVLFPEIVSSVVSNDEAKKNIAMNRSVSALANELMKRSVVAIEAKNQEKNKLVSNSYWYNPISYFHNQLNSIAQTHYNDYQEYRNEVQSLVDKQIRTMVLDIWNDVEVDKAKFLQYRKALASYEN